MSESSAVSSAAAAEPEPASEAPASTPPVRVEPQAKPARKSGKRWSVRPRLVDPERRAAVVGTRQAVLVVDNVSVSFDGFKAITDLTLILDKGELRCLIGPNGAGKTTLMDMDRGRSVADGEMSALSDELVARYLTV